MSEVVFQNKSIEFKFSVSIKKFNKRLMVWVLGENSLLSLIMDSMSGMTFADKCEHTFPIVFLNSYLLVY